MEPISTKRPRSIHERRTGFSRRMLSPRLTDLIATAWLGATPGTDILRQRHGDWTSLFKGLSP
jgi:hypothetical protein